MMKRLFYVVIALQLLFLIGEAATNQVALTRGSIVNIHVVPVDPRSLFMGNYMTLSYDISTIDLSKINLYDGFIAYKPGSTIYVRLYYPPQAKWAKPDMVSTKLPGENSPGSGSVFLRGRVLDRTGNIIQVAYGLERYYIPEARSEEVNRLQWNSSGRQPDITVEVSVASNGKGHIRRVMVNGKPLDF
jgi:uncharacterized membrane-anchored protein